MFGPIRAALAARVRVRARTNRTTLRVEALEQRDVLSWAGVPPSLIAVPSNAVAVALNAQNDAQGTASIASTEVDYYTFTAPTSGSYRLAASTPASNLDPVLGVFNAGGQRIAYNDDISFSNTDSQLNVNLTAGTKYYFGVTNYTNTPSGSYSWLVDGPGAPTATDDSFENNDTLAQSSDLGTLTARRTISNLVMADAADWFRFQMNSTSTDAAYVSISFQHSRGDLDLRLHDSQGTLVRLSDGVTDSERISLNGLAAGTYFVQVYGYRGVSNPNYTLDINPATGSPPPSSNPTLYLVTEGATIGRSDLARYAGSDWSGMVNQFDSDGNGITIGQFLAGRTDREQVINRMIALVQEDVRPFGIAVVRHSGPVVEGQGASTIFLGQSSLTGGLFHVACDIDQGNNNRTDIAFVGNENWGSTESTAIALADVTIHEAGHTFGLWHTNTQQGGVVYAETMGLRYTLGQSRTSEWVQNTSYLDRTFVEFVDSSGFRHGPGPQNSYRTMLQNFGQAAAPVSQQVVTIDTSRNGVLTITGSGVADTIIVQARGQGVIDLTMNGRAYSLLGSGLREIHVYTQGDSRDRAQVRGNLGSTRFFVHQEATSDLGERSKVASSLTAFWNGTLPVRFLEDSHEHEEQDTEAREEVDLAAVIAGGCGDTQRGPAIQQVFGEWGRETPARHEPRSRLINPVRNVAANTTDTLSTDRGIDPEEVFANPFRS